MCVLRLNCVVNEQIFFFFLHLFGVCDMPMACHMHNIPNSNECRIILVDVYHSGIIEKLVFAKN